MSEVIKKSKVKGVFYVIESVSSFRYLKIMHERSGKPIVSFTDAPILRSTDIIKLAETVLDKANWNLPESRIGKPQLDVAKELRKRIFRNNHGVYVVS